MLTCPGSGGATLLDGSLPRLALRVGASNVIRIVTIGSSSTAGAGATTPARSYPSQLEIDLLRRFPGHDIDVVNAGINGQEIRDMVARLDRDVLAHRPDLVVWQFASNGLMRGVPVPVMEAAALDGIRRIQAAGADVLLMDLQHAPRIDGVATRDAILAMMERVSAATGAALFRRYRLMKAWAASMGAGYARMVHADQLHMTDDSYRCMAGAMAASLQAVVSQSTLAAPPAGDVAARAIRTSSSPLRPPSPPAAAAAWP